MHKKARPSGRTIHAQFCAFSCGQTSSIRICSVPLIATNVHIQNSLPAFRTEAHHITEQISAAVLRGQVNHVFLFQLQIVMASDQIVGGNLIMLLVNKMAEWKLIFTRFIFGVVLLGDPSTHLLLLGSDHDQHEAHTAIPSHFSLQHPLIK